MVGEIHDFFWPYSVPYRIYANHSHSLPFLFPSEKVSMMIVLLLTSEHLATVVTRSYLLVSVLYKQVAIYLLTHYVSILILTIIDFLSYGVKNIIKIRIITCLFFKCFKACTHLLFVFCILLLLPESSFSSTIFLGIKSSF